MQNDSGEAWREPGRMIEEVRVLIVAAGVERKDVDAVASDDDLHQSGLIHSLLLVRLVLNIEKRFNIRIANGDFDLVNFQTLNRISGLILRYLRRRPAAP